MSEETLQELIGKYLGGTATVEEKMLVESWYRQVNREDIELPFVSEEEVMDVRARMKRRLEEGIRKTSPVMEMGVYNDETYGEKRRTAWFGGWRAAAAIMILLGSGAAYFFMTRHGSTQALASVQYKGDVLPGHNGAILQLSNGRKIVLDSVQNGMVALQGGIHAVKVDGGLRYTGQSNEVIYNTVSTNRGRQWQLTLPDGTKVWLNAESSIHYPLAFTGGAREVEITGEAYFEVVHNAQQPFRVHAGGKVIEDVGTAFNVNAYGDEPGMKTTLVEGAVKIGDHLLRPGQQAMVVHEKVRVSAGNIGEATAWRNGLFSFDHADIYTVMRQLARWYNVAIKFEGVPENVPFQGEIGRGLTLAQVLKGLEQIHVHFRIEEDKRIVILP